MLANRKNTFPGSLIDIVFRREEDQNKYKSILQKGDFVRSAAVNLTNQLFSGFRPFKNGIVI